MLVDKCICGRLNGTIELHGSVRARRCECGVARIESDQTDAQYLAQYEDGSYHESSSRHPGCIPYHQRYANDYRVAGIRVERYAQIVNWRRNLRTLDVGCANGAFVHYLRRMGMLAFGIDRNRILPRWCVRGTVQNMRIARGRFGLLTYHDVLEHILDPADELRSARKFMGEDGFLIVDVPDVSVDQGQHHWKAEHVWYFNFEALRSLFHGAGFDVVGEDRPIPGKLVLYGAAA